MPASTDGPSVAVPESMTKRACATQLFGAWSIKAEHFTAMWQQAREFLMAHGAPPEPKAQEDDPDALGSVPVTKSGAIAMVGVHGPLTKHAHSFQAIFGGTATADVRQVLQQLANDDGVEAILLHIDSPGGSVAGTGDLADDVAQIAKTKPVFAFGEDLVASAAYWIGSQATHFFASPNAEIGSIGTFAQVFDDSEAFKQMGVRAFLVKAGEHKGDFAQGLPVTKEMLAELQRNVNELNDLFVQGVARGRDMSFEQASKLADGRVHLAEDAKKLGLIDEVASLHGALRAISKRLESRAMSRKQARQTAGLWEVQFTPGASSASLDLSDYTMATGDSGLSHIPLSSDGRAHSDSGSAPTNTEGGLHSPKDSEESGQEGTTMSEQEQVKSPPVKGEQTDPDTPDPEPVKTTQGKDEPQSVPLSMVQEMLAERDQKYQADLEKLEGRLNAREEAEQQKDQEALTEHRNRIAAKYGLDSQELEVYGSKEALDRFDAHMSDQRATVIGGLGAGRRPAEEEESFNVAAEYEKTGGNPRVIHLGGGRRG